MSSGQLAPQPEGGMQDRIFRSFLETQLRDGLALARESDLLDLTPMDGPPVQQYLVHFDVEGRIRCAEGVVPARGFVLGIRFPDDYQLRANPADVVRLIEPREVWHPNARYPFVCPGDLRPGTPLPDLIYQLWEILTYRKVTSLEREALNRGACGWARKNMATFPTDPRPLRRRRVAGSENPPPSRSESAL